MSAFGNGKGLQIFKVLSKTPPEVGTSYYSPFDSVNTYVPFYNILVDVNNKKMGDAKGAGLRSSYRSYYHQILQKEQ